jgi:hypothetical protein
MGKYSQGGFVILLCSAKQDALCNVFVLIDFKSNKSKRVATSTLHAEALACIASVENATFVQTYFLELHTPSVTTLQLLSPEKYELIPIVTVSDCADLHSSLIAPAISSLPNKHLGLYIAALREFRTLGRIEANVWCDTRDMLSNSLTKIKEDGSTEPEINHVLKTGSWQLKHPYQWNNTWCSET